MDSPLLSPTASAINVAFQAPSRAATPQGPAPSIETHDGSAAPSPVLAPTHPALATLTPPAPHDRTTEPASDLVPALPWGLGPLTAWLMGQDRTFPKEVEAAAKVLGLDKNSTFETYDSDSPAFTEVLDLSQAKAHVEACYYKCADEADEKEEDWNFLLQTTQALLRTVSWTAEARKWCNILMQQKPDGLDALVMLNALCTMDANKRRHVAKEAKPLFDLLHPADYPTLLAALQHVDDRDMARFCKDALRFALGPYEVSKRAKQQINNVGDVLAQGNLTLAMVRPKPTTDAPYDNLAVLCNLVGLGEETRHLAVEAAKMLAMALEWRTLPRELAHVFWATSGSALLWSDAVISLVSKLRDDPPYLGTSNLSETDKRAFMVELFRAQIERGQPDAPPPYSAAESESNAASESDTDRPAAAPPPKGA